MIQALNASVDWLNETGALFVDFATTMSIQVAVVIGVIGILDFFFFRKMRSTVRYAIWSIVLVKLALPVTFESSLSVSRLLPPAVKETPRIASTATTIHPLEFNTSTDEQDLDSNDTSLTFQPKPIGQSTAQSRGHQVRGTDESQSANSTDVEKTQPRAASMAFRGMRQLTWQGGWFSIWLFVVVTLTFNTLRLTARMRRLVMRSGPISQEAVGVLRNCRREVGIRREIQAVATDEIPGPAIFGLYRPTILLPSSLASRLSANDLRFVFLHELSHFKRHDLLVSCIQTLLQILYFFHPLVWGVNYILRNLREKAVDEFVLATAKEEAVQQYSSTLVNIATTQHDNPQLVLSFSGMQSRFGLANRIKTMLHRPIPKRTGIGLVGLMIVLVLGAILIPNAPQNTNVVAAEPQNKSSESESQTNDDADEPPVIKGTISDEDRRPVTDAKIQLTHVKQGASAEATTDANGNYSISNIAVTGEYRMKIESKAWVGVTRWRELPIVNLEPGKTLTKDLTLSRACQIRIEIVDEQGAPIQNVSVMAKLISNDDGYAPESVRSDANGMVTLSGLKPQKTEYLIGTMHKDYGFGKIEIQLNDPTKIASKKLVLKKGTEISGTAICSDGLPPSGWRIRAMPSWWNFGRYPTGQIVKDDGSFTLPHIVEGNYDVSISIPRGENGSSPRNVLKATNLSQIQSPISVKLDHPSPQSLVAIKGKIVFEGPAPPKGFWIFARSSDNDIRKSSSIYVDRGVDEFQIQPVQKGRYELTVSDTQAEAEKLYVNAPTAAAVLKVRAKAKPRAVGVVVDAAKKRPIKSFRVQLRKRSTLRGPNFVQELTWHHFRNDQGRFDVELVGPGIYEAVVAADGFRWEHSELINTDKNQGEPVQIELREGVSFSGTVVDEDGQPVDGATVIALSKSAGTMPRVTKTFVTQDGSVRTKKGKFKFQHLRSGPETFKITHPDYCFTVRQIEITNNESESVEFVLTRGGTVNGHVYDENGRPRVNATLIFHDKTGYGGGMDEEAGRLATVVTDQAGYYEASGLPEQLCYVHLQKEWQSRGVVRHCVLPKNGETISLEFGGDSKLTGRLIVNGTAQVGRRLLVSGDSPHFGIYKAYSVTRENGEFEFRGLAAGNRKLYYLSPNHSNRWIRIREIKVPLGSLDLGDIEQTTGKLFVRVDTKGEVPLDSARASLITYDPVWTHGRQTGVNTKRSDGGSVEIAEVPLGKYELTLYHRDYFQVRKPVTMTAESLRQKFNLDLPVGTATLSGKVILETGSESRGYSGFDVWNKERTLRRTLFPQEDGTFELKNVPAGEYLIFDGHLRNMKPVKSITVKEGEKVRFNLTQKATNSIGEKFYFVVRPFFKNSPLPCDVYLESSRGDVFPQSSQNARYSFVGEPGNYTVVVKHPGLTTVQMPIELAKTEDVRQAKELDISLSLPN